MLTLYEFNAKDDNGRAEIAWSGTYLGQREEGDQIIQLYSLQDFYAEVFYDPEHNGITRVRGFKKLHLLAPYIGEVRTPLTFRPGNDQ